MTRRAHLLIGVACMALGMASAVTGVAWPHSLPVAFFGGWHLAASKEQS